MPFKFINTLAIFQAYINRVLVGLIDIICIIYLDDILIFSDTHEDYIKYVYAVFNRLHCYGFYINLKKYKLF